jgi:hypothetical protein
MPGQHSAATPVVRVIYQPTRHHHMSTPGNIDQKNNVVRYTVPGYQVRQHLHQIRRLAYLTRICSYTSLAMSQSNHGSSSPVY